MHILAEARTGHLPSDDAARGLAQVGADALPELLACAAQLRDRHFRNLITYSRKVFIPLTQLCRDVCHYCTFARTPRHLAAPYMSVDEVLAVARRGAEVGCKEALLTLGEKPELRYGAARDALAAMGFRTTLEYVAHVAERIFTETGLLPHVNAGCMDADEIAMLRAVAPSMGIMLESTAERLCEKGMVHHGSPDKHPAVRLETLRLAGEARVPFTTGILIGIGETRLERIESLLAIRALHQRYGHIQEVIIQNFRAKAGTKMAQAPEPDLPDLLWTIAVARIIFGPDMSIQAPPNLSPGVLPRLIAAGINDWGGVSPLTPDYVNPEAPWPHLEQLSAETTVAGKHLLERLTVYPGYVRAGQTWLDERFRTPVMRIVDAEGYPKTDSWAPGEQGDPPAEILAQLAKRQAQLQVSPQVTAIVAKAMRGEDLAEADIVRLFQARGDDLAHICQAADDLRQCVNGDTVSYVVNRNINYTNVCYFKCQFCAFSKGKLSENLRGRPYDLDENEIARRAREAWERGASEVCMTGGIHPEYTGQTYLDIVKAVKTEVPDMHVHAFSPLEIWQGAASLGLPVAEFLQRLKAQGLGTLPGTAAEILDDEARVVLCPDKLSTQQWLDVMEQVHRAGFRTTATIMFGHVETLEHWARHIIRVRDLQKKTGGFTEFVPLPFVHMEAPIYLKGRARSGPSFREALLMHAVARLALHPHIANIQVSWVKMGAKGARVCLDAGVNDLGGTLMNETITRAAGATHGQEFNPQVMEELIRSMGRSPRQRLTTYGDAPAERQQRAWQPAPLQEVTNTPCSKYERPDGAKPVLIRRDVEMVEISS
ncbi:MAG: 5-amino-6-(D-ribitylamino)uracil--L-tyrosine 4-hydroxyphenyl transferase CofH [Porticoccaceae bacterium]